VKGSSRRSAAPRRLRFNSPSQAWLPIPNGIVSAARSTFGSPGLTLGVFSRAFLPWVSNSHLLHDDFFPLFRRRDTGIPSRVVLHIVHTELGARRKEPLFLAVAIDR